MRLLQFAVPGGEVPVNPGTAQVDMIVRVPWRLVGRPADLPLPGCGDAAEGLAPLRLDGSREAGPLFARWVPIPVAAMVLLVALASLVLPRL